MTGSDLRSARMALGLTQVQMADMLGITSVYVSLIERGAARNPSPSLGLLVRAYLDGYRPENWPVK